MRRHRELGGPRKLALDPNVEHAGSARAVDIRTSPIRDRIAAERATTKPSTTRPTALLVE